MQSRFDAGFYFRARRPLKGFAGDLRFRNADVAAQEPSTNESGNRLDVVRSFARLSDFRLSCFMSPSTNCGHSAARGYVGEVPKH
jgi:hypothetical protein